jgi:hypothetical protein
MECRQSLQVKASGTVKEPSVITEGIEYSEQLFHYAYASQIDDVNFIEYRLLQQANIFRIQNELAKLKAACWNESGR